MKYLIILVSLFFVESIFCQSVISSEEIKAIYFKAERLKINKKYQEAITLYSEIINTGSSKYLLHSYLGRGNCKSWSRDFEAAISDFDNAIAVNDKNKSIYKAYSGKAKAYNKLKIYDKAIESAKKSIAINPDYPYSYHNLSTALLYSKNFKPVEEIISKAIDNLALPINKKYKNYELNIMYFNRGLAKIKLNDKKNGCIDMKKSRELGYTKYEKFYKENCF